MAKRFNRTVQTPQETILVAEGNQALATGAFLAGANALNIASGQYGVLSADQDGVTAANNFITAGQNTAQVKKVKVVRGTPYSSDLRLPNVFGIGTKAYLDSPVIDPKGIVSVYTTLPEIAQYSMVKHTGLTAPTVSTDYQMTILLESITKDIEWAPQKRLTITGHATTPATAPTNITDWLLQHLAVDINQRSILTNGVGEQFMVLGLGTAGGTAIGALTAGTSINVELNGGVQYTYTATTPFIKALQQAVVDGTLLATDHIMNLNLATAGAGANVTGLLVVALEERPAVIYDEETRNIVHIKSSGINISNTTTTVTKGKDWVGTGKQWQFRWKKRAGMKYYFENWYKCDGAGSIETAPSYITGTDAQLYTSTIITFNKTEAHTTEFEQTIPHTLVFLLPASIDNPSADVATPYTVSTDATTTVTQLNASLGVWLAHAATEWTNHKYLGNATSAAPFV